MAKENREHKDSVFRDLFHTDDKARENLLQLYNALYNTSYTDPELIEYIGLEDILFKDLKNDLAFTMNQERLVLSEHQSTVCYNIPLRNLLYIAREYEKIVLPRDRYRSKPIKIPTPKFIVFYNGQEDFPKEKILKLSDLYQEQEGMAELELTVRVININPDKKHEILEKCEVLKEYSQFVEITRKYQDDEKQLQKTIQECIRQGILADYLYRKSSEVINMLMDEYSYETDMEVQREEAAEEKFLEYVDKLAKKMNITVEEACEILDESYDRYKELKRIK